jgi:hypothetical protein
MRARVASTHDEPGVGSGDWGVVVPLDASPAGRHAAEAITSSALAADFRMIDGISDRRGVW